MKNPVYRKLISIFLALIMITSNMSLSAFSVEDVNDAIGSSLTELIADMYWEVIEKPLLKPGVTMSGLPDNAEPGFEVVMDQYDLSSRKSASAVGEVLDIYDIKAVDKVTGEEIHPTEEVEVTITNARARKDHTVYLIHVLDDEEVIKNTEGYYEISNAAFVSAFKDAAAAAERATGKSGIVCVEYIDDLQRDGYDITFKTNSFSIYIIGEGNKRLVYKFINGNEIVSEQYVRAGDTLYDPGLSSDTYTASYGKKFKGWSKSVNGLNSLITIQDLNTELAAVNWDNVNDLDVVEVYAQFKNAYFLRYMIVDEETDETNIAHIVMKEEDEADKNVQLDFVPQELSSNTLFRGWVDAATGVQYQRDQIITLDHHIDLYAKFEGQYWLVFDANAGGPGSGVEYTPPQLLIGDARTVDPTPNNDLERSGYTFLGWYTDPTGGSRFTFGNTLSQDTTLYAHWQAKETNYYVVFWKQKTSAIGTDKETDYDYVSSDTRIAVTDQVVNTTNDDRTKGGTTGSTYGYFFTYNAENSDTTATVAANGTTVLNVYYDRREITYTFTSNNGNFTITRTYGTVDGEEVELIPYGDGKWYYKETVTETLNVSPR